MNRKFSILILLVFLIFSLSSCKSTDKGNNIDLNIKDKDEDTVGEKETGKDLVRVKISDIDLEANNLIVDGIGKAKDILSDKSIVNLEDTKIYYNSREFSKENLGVGDILDMEVKEIRETYPSQVETEYIILIKTLEKEKTVDNSANKSDSAKEDNRNNEIKEESDKEVSREKDLKKVTVKRIYEDIEVKDFDYVYKDLELNGEYTILELENISLDKVQIYSLKYEGDSLLEDQLLFEQLDLKSGDKFFIDSYYPEGIPSRKIKWKVKNGKEDEYILQYDGRGDRPDSLEYIY